MSEAAATKPKRLPRPAEVPIVEAPCFPLAMQWRTLIRMLLRGAPRDAAVELRRTPPGGGPLAAGVFGTAGLHIRADDPCPPALLRAIGDDSLGWKLDAVVRRGRYVGLSVLPVVYEVTSKPRGGSPGLRASYDPFYPHWEDTVRRAREFVAPSMILTNGPRACVLWALTEPVRLRVATEVAQVRALLARLAERVGATVPGEGDEIPILAPGLSEGGVAMPAFAVEIAPECSINPVYFGG